MSGVRSDKPVDGGWGWIIVISAFVTSAIVDGVKYTFGIIFLELVDTFHESRSSTSLIISIQIGALLLTGMSHCFNLTNHNNLS